MLIVRSPLRVSLFGGGTDIEPFMSQYGGVVLSFSLAKYIYLSIHPLVDSQDILLKYSTLEKVANNKEIKHPVLREISKRYTLKSVDIAVSSDISAGTGLGSSSSFTVGAVNLVRNYLSLPTNKYDLALEACEIEIDILGEPIGIQDQFAAAIGGMNILNMGPGRSVKVEPIFLSEKINHLVTENMILIKTGLPRRASTILNSQNMPESQSKNFESLQELKSIAAQGKLALESGPKELGNLLSRSWKIKQSLANGISNSDVEKLYDFVMDKGAYGAKLLGAGGSGYLLVVMSENLRRQFVQDSSLNTLEVKIDCEGSKVIYAN